MKVLNLQCGLGHLFEGWFASHDDYTAQHGQGLLTCPLCGDAQIVKRPSAPRLNLGHEPVSLPGAASLRASVEQDAAAHGAASAADNTAGNATGSDAGRAGGSAGGSAGGRATGRAASNQPASAQEVSAMHLQAAWMKMARHILANTEDVGAQFAQEARKIHHGETEHRNIRGQASREEAEALLDEGIDILPLPLPAGLKEPLQ